MGEEEGHGEVVVGAICTLGQVHSEVVEVLEGEGVVGCHHLDLRQEYLNPVERERVVVGPCWEAVRVVVGVQGLANPVDLV